MSSLELKDPAKLNELLTPLLPEPPVISATPFSFFLDLPCIILRSLDYDLKAEVPTLAPLVLAYV